MVCSAQFEVIDSVMVERAQWHRQEAGQSQLICQPEAEKEQK